MTNFYLNYGQVLDEQTVAGTVFTEVPRLTDGAIGVERWCTLRDGYGNVSTREDMAALLASVRATAMYDLTKTPLWYTECTGGELTIHSGQEEFDRELRRQTELFRIRDRADPGSSWITWHTSVYDIACRTLWVYSQEDYSVCFRFSLSE